MTGVIRSDIIYDDSDDKLIHKTSQPTEDLILDRNAELRKNPGVIQDLGAQTGETWGRQVASIPFIVYEKALRDGFELNHTDHEYAGKEMHRFLQTVEGRACLVR